MSKYKAYNDGDKKEKVKLNDKKVEIELISRKEFKKIPKNERKIIGSFSKFSNDGDLEIEQGGEVYHARLNKKSRFFKKGYLKISKTEYVAYINIIQAWFVFLSVLFITTGSTYSVGTFVYNNYINPVDFDQIQDTIQNNPDPNQVTSNEDKVDIGLNAELPETENIDFNVYGNYTVVNGDTIPLSNPSTNKYNFKYIIKKDGKTIYGEGSDSEGIVAPGGEVPWDCTKVLDKGANNISIFVYVIDGNGKLSNASPEFPITVTYN